MREYKKVVVKGITWTILSANERTCQVEDRHFMASRCTPKSMWFLREHNCDIISSADGAKEVGYCRFRLATEMLSLAVLHIVGTKEVLPARDMSQPLTHLVGLATNLYIDAIYAVKLPAAAKE